MSALKKLLARFARWRHLMWELRRPHHDKTWHSAVDTYITLCPEGHYNSLECTCGQVFWKEHHGN